MVKKSLALRYSFRSGDKECHTLWDKASGFDLRLMNTNRKDYVTMTTTPGTSLVVLKFPASDGAANMLGRLESLQKQQLITVVDGAIVSWPAGAKKPKTEQLRSMTGVGALGGAFWGMLFGLLFFVPFFGLAVGAAMGALAGHFAHYGIDDDFINSVRSKITPGTSALFLLTSGAVLDKVVEAVKDIQFEIIQTNLSKEQEAALKEAFGE
jgi:uncharacterized membrane protein